MATAKKVNFELIPERDGPSYDHIPEPYRLLDELRVKHHPDIAEARIALAFRKNWTSDKDGHLVLGKCVKASDLQRELVDYHFVILLNWEVWHDPEFDTERKLALLDHELCHADIARDEEGESVRDERDRPAFRIRKHDIEEFNCIVARHGCYKRDLERFAEALMAKKNSAQQSMFGKPKQQAATMTQ